jgi:hypothetical protein
VKQARKAHQRLAFLTVSKTRANKFYTSRQCTNTVYLSGKVKRFKTPAKLSENS